MPLDSFLEEVDEEEEDEEVVPAPVEAEDPAADEVDPDVDWGLPGAGFLLPAAAASDEAGLLLPGAG